uniref:DUF1985 domain-containing protein n=1 Tax=Lactuca sativa TaxID=4236 RepID=A0A9R1VMD4_LACSA|nr:hypothetical protein LSAT_V11C500247110 [Lactuca sativa]
MFGYLLDVPQLQGDWLLFHKMFLYQLRPDAIVSPDSIKRLYFKLGDTKLVYGPEEFFFIIGFNFGVYPKLIGKKVSKKKLVMFIAERLFPNHTNSSEKICDLKSYQPFLAAIDDDAVRACLIYVLCECYLGKEANDRVPQDWVFFSENLDGWSIFAWDSYLWEFTYDYLEDTWNKFNKYLSLPKPCQPFKYPVSVFTASFKYFMLPSVRGGGFTLRKNKHSPRMNRWSATKKLKWVDVNKIFDMTKNIFLLYSCQEYVYDEPHLVSSPVQNHFRRQDKSSCSVSSSGLSHGRGGRSGKPRLEEFVKQLFTLEQQVYMNRERTEVIMEEVDDESIWNNINFDEPKKFQTKFSFDEKVSDTLH